MTSDKAPKRVFFKEYVSKELVAQIRRRPVIYPINRNFILKCKEL